MKFKMPKLSLFFAVGFSQRNYEYASALAKFCALQDSFPAKSEFNKPDSSGNTF
ncbi:hypothetical protein [Pedobacter sp. Leaf41]|uniref:hypothetical protein n=1 Tax=Pedobacter sp. Leaf41 TaxID=1736218 RepID=UPI000B0AF290|nr:hypothetical protein [Pedobacter sp. Leaf41]